MSLKLTCNAHHRHIEQEGTTTTPYATDYLRQFWEWLTTPTPDQTSTFDPARCQVLSYHVSEQVAQAHIDREFTPLYDLSEREIEHLSSEASFGEVLDHLHMLSLMEKGIEDWRESHQFSAVKTPRAVHTLYTKLFAKVDRLPHMLMGSPPTSERGVPVPRLVNASGTNCFFNVVLQTLFSNYELARSVVFSEKQPQKLKLAFLEFREIVLTNCQVPIDLASSLRSHYDQVAKPGQHDMAELMTLMMKDSDGTALCALRTITAYRGFEDHLDRLEGFGDNGTRSQDTLQAVYTLPLAEKQSQPLEALLFSAFNEIITDETPIEFSTKDGTEKIYLPRATVTTRYLSAPKFLIYNLGRANLNEKENVFIGLQQTFYLSGELTCDHKGAKYSLQSFNVHVGENPGSGHYIHYRHVAGRYYRYSDEQSKEISSIEYLLAAQNAYVIVLQREEFVTPEEIFFGTIQNHNRFNAMRFINNMICALQGQPMACSHPSRAPLEVFIESLLSKDPSEEVFAALDFDLQQLLLKLWSRSGSIEEMVETIKDQTTDRKLPPQEVLEGYFFSHGKELMAMMDFLAMHVLKHPEDADFDAQSPQMAVLASIASISAKKQIAILRGQAVAYEIGHMALAIGTSAFRLKRAGKEVSFKALRQDSEVLMQSASSLFGFTRAYFDPRSQNKTFQFIQKWMTPAISVVRTLKRDKQWSFSPFLSPATSVLLERLPLSPTAQTMASSLAPVLLADIATPSLREAWSEPGTSLSFLRRFGTAFAVHLRSPGSQQELGKRLSAMIGLASQLLKAPLQGESRALYFRSLTEAVRSGVVQVVMTNSSLQSLISDLATERIARTYYVSPLAEAYQAKTAELDQAIKAGDEEAVERLVKEMKRLGEEFKAFGGHFEPSKLDDYVTQKRHRLAIKQKEMEFEETRDKLSKAIDEKDSEAIQAAATEVLEKASQLREMGVEPSPELEAWLRDVELQKDILNFQSVFDEYYRAVGHGDDERASKLHKIYVNQMRDLGLRGVIFDHDPTINPEVESHLILLQPELEREKRILADNKAGEDAARAKAKEKSEKLTQLENQKKRDLKKENEAEKKKDAAQGKLRAAKKSKDDQQAKVDALEKKVQGLKRSLHSPIESQHYKDRVADEKAIWTRKETERRQKVLEEKEQAVKTTKKTFDRAKEKYDKKWEIFTPATKEYDAFIAAGNAYKTAVEERNQALEDLGRSGTPAFPRAPKGDGFIDKALRGFGRVYDKTSDILTKVGFSGGATVGSMPLYNIEAPKSSPSTPGVYGPEVSMPRVSKPTTSPVTNTQPATEPNLVMSNPFLPEYVSPLAPSSHPNILETMSDRSPNSPPSISVQGGYYPTTYDAQLAQTLSDQRAIESRRLAFAADHNAQPYTAPAPRHPTETFRSTFARDQHSQPYASPEAPKPIPPSTKTTPQATHAASLLTPGLLHQPSLLRPTIDPFQIEASPLETGPTKLVKDGVTFMGEVQEQVRRDPIQALQDITYGTPVLLGRAAKDLVQFSLEHSPVGHFTNANEHIERFATFCEDKYLAFLEFTGTKVHPDSPAPKLFTEVVVWTIPVTRTAKRVEYTGQAIKHTRKDFFRWIRNGLQKEGFHVPAEALEASFPKWAEKEYLQATHQVEKRAIPKTAPSATKAEAASSSVKKTLETVEGISSKEIQIIEQKVSSWLGEETRLIRNKAGDPIFLSKDGTKRVRFDFNNSHGDKMHMHIEEKVGSRWTDVSSVHRIYPKDL